MYLEPIGLALIFKATALRKNTQGLLNYVLDYYADLISSQLKIHFLQMQIYNYTALCIALEIICPKLMLRFLDDSFISYLF